MKLLKLTALSSIVFTLLLAGSSCERIAEEKKTTDFQKNAIPVTGAQETPATTTSALGTLDVFYSKETRILTYTVKWSGLTGNVTAAHIHGLAPVGYAAVVVQTFTINTITPCAPGPPTNTTCGTYSGTLLADGVVVKEQDILNGLYYVNLHTAVNPNGEIRGQIRFQ